MLIKNFRPTLLLLTLQYLTKFLNPPYVINFNLWEMIV